MKSLEFLSLVPPVRRDNFNRDSSACKSRAGYVIHSGIHRSTAFVSRTDAVASLEYWKAQGGLNPWVEGTIEGLSLDDCELNAIVKVNPDWRFSTVKNGGACRNSQKTAILHENGFQTILSAGSWQELNERIKLG
jgi:hypothetical protein